MDFVEKDEANNLIAKSILASQYRKKIYDSNSSDQMRKLYIDDCRGEKLTFDRINLHIDLMWKSVDGASLWWKHSGDYAQMHKKLKEIRMYVKKQPKDKRIEGDDKFKKMLDDLKTASEVYRNNKESSKTLEEIKDSANGIARYNAAKGVALVVDSIWNIERKAQLAEQKRTQAEKQEQTENQKPVENTNPYNVDYILQQLKEQKAVPENLSREMLSLAVIVGVPVKKENLSERDKQMYDERKQKIKDLLTAMANPDGVLLNQEQKDLLNQNIEKVQKAFKDHVKVNKAKLHAYNNLMFEHGCENYMSLGGRFLQGLGSGYFVGKDKGIPAASAVLIREANIWDKTNSILVEELPSGKYVLEDEVKMIVVAKLLKESHSEISKNSKGNGKNVIAMLQFKEGNAFVSDIYDQVKDILNLKDKNGYVKLDDFNAALENNKEKIQKAVNAYSKAELDRAKKQIANENAVQEKAVEQTVQKKAEIPAMGKK